MCVAAGRDTCVQTPATERQRGKVFADGGGVRTEALSERRAGADVTLQDSRARPRDRVHTLEKPRCVGRGFSLFPPLVSVARPVLQAWGRVPGEREQESGLALPFLKECLFQSSERGPLILAS